MSGCTLNSEKILRSGDFNGEYQHSYLYEEEIYVYLGNVFVEGYTTIEKMPEPFCEDCEPRDVIFFNVTKVRNNNFEKFLKEGVINTKEDAIGIGCMEDDLIVYGNSSTAFGAKNYKLSYELTNEIMSSTENSPVVLELEIHPSLPGGAGPCYSWATRIHSVSDGREYFLEL